MAMKRCEQCILNSFTKEEYKCDGDMDARECIGKLQGIIEMLADNYSLVPNPDNQETAIVHYTVYGNGSFYIPANATEEEMLARLVYDCDEKEIHIEYDI